MNPHPLRTVPVRLHPDAVAEFLPTLRAALAGEYAILPVPDAPDAAREELVAALRPELGVPADDPAAVVIATSGSTGVAKGVLLTARALIASAQAATEHLGGPGHWLLALSPQHIAGLQVVLRSMVSGSALVTIRPGMGRGFAAAPFAAAVAGMPAGRRYTSLVPAQLSRVLDDEHATAAAASLDAILLGGAAASDALLDGARSRSLRVITTYGMTETSGGCVYDGAPLAGVRVQIAGEGPGPIRFAGPMLASGYLRAPEASAAAFADGWFSPRDLGRMTAGRLEVLGRSDDVIVTGGEKVPPLLVARALEAHPGVRASCVLALPDPVWGQIIAAAVTVTDRCAGLADRLREAVGDTVGRHAVPRRIAVLDELPMLPSGKVDRQAVRKLLQ